VRHLLKASLFGFDWLCRNVPLAIVTDKDGKPSIENTPLLTERATHIGLDTSKPFKLNAGTAGVCMSCCWFLSFYSLVTSVLVDRVLYTPERLTAIAAEAAKEQSTFSLDDRLGLVHDVFALAKAGLAKASSALTLVDLWKNEKECKGIFRWFWQKLISGVC
jgi:aminopeptidase 2